MRLETPDGFTLIFHRVTGHCPSLAHLNFALENLFYAVVNSMCLNGESVNTIAGPASGEEWH